MQSNQSCYPRLFANENDRPEPIEANLESFANLASGFAALTGWTLKYRETPESRVRREGIGCRHLPIQARIAIDDLSEETIRGATRASQREKCERVIDGINSILEELDRTRDEVWRKNAELATGIPVTDDGSAAEKLAVLLNSLLTSAIDITGAKRAALYVLDDGTQNLNLRTHVGFGQNQIPATSRDLSRAKADLEALMGHAVVLEDSTRFVNWDIPSDCGSALCLPISSANNLLGTLWVMDQKPRDFTGAETNMVEIIAGRVAAELERFALLQMVRVSKSTPPATNPFESIARPQLPNIHPPIDELKIFGAVSDAENHVAAGAVYDWAICRQGRLAVLVAHAAGDPMHAARVATVLQTAFRAHSSHCESAIDLFDSVFETAMSVGSGDNPVRFICGYLDPAAGRCELASTDVRVGAIVSEKNMLTETVDADAVAAGEFGLAHLAQISIPVQSELVLTVASSPSSVEDSMRFECTLAEGEEGFASDVAVATEPDAGLLALLQIKRVR